jgi:hypothetical protein
VCREIVSEVLGRSGSFRRMRLARSFRLGRTDIGAAVPQARSWRANAARNLLLLKNFRLLYYFGQQ